ncbi:MAG: hypothetical protein HKL90_14970 [Elusimicrobia bacterium]|nr:hypothetical protein [Elusimicrobiota bacterium]
MIPLILAVFFAPAAGAATPSAAVRASTATAADKAPALPMPPALALSTYTVSTLYTGDQVRDPFLPPSASPHKRAGGSPDVVDIHSVQLRGILKDEKTDYAVFTNDFGATLILRGGRLYDERSRVVPGITGRIKPKQKWVELMTADKDVQPFHLGEPSADAGDGNP